jgi:hypothetical protein
MGLVTCGIAGTSCSGSHGNSASGPSGSGGSKAPGGISSAGGTSSDAGGAPTSCGTNGASGTTGTACSTKSKSVAKAITAGWRHTCALLSDGSIQCWGDNGGGTDSCVDFAQGTISCSTTPVMVKGITNAVAISAGVGGNYTCALLSNVSIQCWGGSNATPTAVSGISNAIAIGAGRFHTCAVLSTGSIQCWGDNDFGNLGDGTTTSSSVPVTVLGISNAVGVGAGYLYSCALLRDGSVQCWGVNGTGELGNSTMTSSSVPVVVSGITDAVALAPGYQSVCAILRTGAVRCWGASAAVPITNAAAIANGDSHICALVSGGSIQCWGDNHFGELGDGTKRDSFAPVTVSCITDAIAVAAGGIHMCALERGGLIQCWGSNEDGQLGNGTTTESSVPVTVCGATAGSGGAGGTIPGSAGNPGGSGGSRSGGAGGTGTASATSAAGVLCPLPAQALITDFTYAPVEAGVADTAFVHFGGPTTLAGGEYLYPTSGSSPLTSDVTNNNWHISGMVGDYSGFGLYFDGCTRVDASAYHGMSFTISGSEAQGDQVALGIGTVNNGVAASWLIANGDATAKPGDPGRCIPASGNRYYHPGCLDATKTIPVTATPTVQKVLWGDFAGGQPEPSVTPSDIISIYWSIPWTATSSPYPVDIVLDDLQFIP